MPHKHTRREKDLALFDLPPTRIARPLPTAPAPKRKGHNKTSTTKVSSTTKVRPKDAPKDAKADGKAVATAPAATTTAATTAPETAAAATAAPPTETKAAAKPKAKDDPRNLKRKREAAKKANKGSVAAAPTLSSDTPRAFRRLMAIAGGKRTRSGLDNGVVKETKRQKKERRARELAAASAAAAAEAGVAGAELQALEVAAAAQAATAATSDTTATAEPLTIRPGEKLADFNRRVDAALPLAGITKNALPNSGGGKDPLGLTKTFRTKQERKLHKLYDQWRQEEIKIKARREEEQEALAENEAELDDEFGVKWRVDFEKEKAGSTSSKRAKRNKGGSGNNYGGGDDDIWADFNRRQAKASKQDAVRAGVHNSVTAPPEKLTRIDTSKFNFAKN